MKSILKFIAIAMIVISLGGCKTKEPVKTQAKGMNYYDTFDTVSFVYSYANDSDEKFEENCKEVHNLLLEYHKYFDIYNEYDGINNLCTVNKNAGISPVEVDEKIITFLKSAIDIYEMTNGNMNVMIGALTKPWHDCRTAALNEKGYLPDYDVLVEAKKHTDINSLVIDENNSTVYISDKDARLDVGAYGKGYATERIAQYLKDKGINSYVLNIGGNIRIVGSKIDGSAWSTGIINPQDEESYAIKINIKDTACVTSGVYERYFVVDGQRYHHIIDPDTLYPSKYYDSVSIIVDDSGLADALSTALFCMSYEDGLELANKYNFDVVWILPNGDIKTTKNVENLIY